MVYESMSYTEYAALPGWRWSHIKLLSRSPKHLKHALTVPDKDTTSRALLRAIHTLALEGREVYEEEVVVFTGATRRGKVWDAFRVCNLGKTILKVGEDVLVRATAEAVRNHPAVAELMAEGRPELSLTWVDEATGLPCKCRIDWLGPLGVLDLKTIGTTDEREVARMVARLQFAGQLAHYADGIGANGLEVPAAYIVAAEGKGAQDVAVFELDSGMPDGALYVGAESRRGLMAQLAECVASDEWPGRHETAQDLILPSWALIDDEITFGEE
ncbi:MAG: hypothetical protein DRQ40_04805 [Gammaproteobacteria bacterium]|nr:MAG: hypothetical protein DRQ40_04805 [Gammaproteobacteria bacterium]